MQKYNRSAHTDNTNTADKATADQEQHLMSMVQSAVTKHFATPPSQPPPIRKPLPNSYALPSNWQGVMDQLNRRINKSTRWHPAVSTLYSLERRSELKPDWHKHWDPDPGHITGIQNDKIYSILSAASEETRANEMNVESCTELDSHANMPVAGKHAYIIAELARKLMYHHSHLITNHLQYPWWMLR